MRNIVRAFIPLMFAMVACAPPQDTHKTSLSSEELKLETNTNEIMRFVVMGHVRSDSQFSINPYFEDALHQIDRENLRPEFIVLAGDSIMGIHLNDRDFTDEWSKFLKFIDDQPFRFFMVPGNHDYQNSS
jgi:hypothetical protein